MYATVNDFLHLPTFPENQSDLWFRKIQVKNAGESRASFAPRGPSRARGFSAGSNEFPAPANASSRATSEAGGGSQRAEQHLSAAAGGSLDAPSAGAKRRPSSARPTYAPGTRAERLRAQSRVGRSAQSGLKVTTAESP